MAHQKFMYVKNSYLLNKTSMKLLKTLIHQFTNNEIDRSTVLKEICISICRILNVSRASLWDFENDFKQIRCVALYDHRTNEYSEGAIIHESTIPPYFESILRDGSIVASDARNNSITAVLTEPYFEPLDIYSLLDHIVFNNGEKVAVLCCEHCGEIRQWSSEDESLLRTMSAIVSILYKF